MKRSLFGGLALVALAGLLATAALGAGRSHARAAASIKIGVSLAGYSTDFWSSYVSYEKKFAKTYDVSLVGPVPANGDAGKQLTDIRTLINEGVNALIVNPVDSAAIAPALEQAAAKHIPVVSVDVGPSAGKVYMVVRADNTLYGKDACKYIGSHAKGAGHVAVLEGDLASINGRDRSNAFISCIHSSYPNLKVASYATKWDTPTAVNDAKTALSAYSDLKGIYVEWSGPVPGILAAEKAVGKFAKVGAPNHVILVSDDGVPFEMADIRNGILDATVSQPANAYAQYAIYYCKQALAHATYHAGMKTGHGSKIVNLLGNLEDAIVAPLVTKANVHDPSLWGNAAAKGH
jgi:simple sugar transport system substrate-binding protein/ribose transport system substrate-binding protein